MSKVSQRLFILAAVAALLSTPGDPEMAEAQRAPMCIGSYSDDLSLASVDARRRDDSTRYSYALRSRAVYQCPYFDREGTLRRRKESVISHGTAFAFRRDAGTTYLVTNEHVTEWPQVTTLEDRVESIPAGCKRVSDHMWLVDDEADEYEADDIEVQRVLVDPALDLSVVKTPTKLPLLPFRMGKSSALRAGNAVEIRGFPLGAFAALSTGKVTNARQHDEEQGWSHTDMIVDAQLSRGQSGSPVLAVSCATRELELVGIYHAGYKDGASLNAAVSIDDLREELTTLKLRKPTSASGPGEAERAHVEAALGTPGALPFVPFGALTVGVRRSDGGLAYDFFGKRFPLTDHRVLVVEDGAAHGVFGAAQHVWLGATKGLCELKLDKLEESDRDLLSRAISALRDQLVRTVRFRELDMSPDKSYARYEKQRALEAELGRSEPLRRDLAKALADLVERVPPEAQGACNDAPRIARP